MNRTICRHLTRFLTVLSLALAIAAGSLSSLPAMAAENNIVTAEAEVETSVTSTKTAVKFASNYLKPADGTYNLISGVGKKARLDVSGGRASDGGNVQIYENNGSNNQKFVIKHQGKGWYTITNVISGKCLDVENGNPAIRTNVQIFTPNGTDAQLWRFYDAGNGYMYIQSKLGNYLDVRGGIYRNRTNVFTFSRTGSKAQKWKLSDTELLESTQVYLSDTAIGQKRAKVVDYIRQMATIKWTPKKTINYWRTTSIKWKKGTYYYGIPYSQWTRNTTVAAFKKKMSGTTYTGPATNKTYMGSDCSSSCSLAYYQVNKKFPITTTRGMFPVYGYCKTVGKYDHLKSLSSSKICKKNGKAVMVKAYENLLPGDLVLHGEGSSGHVRMVTYVGNGYVKCIEQSGLEKGANTSWRVDKVYTLDNLFANNYIPVTMIDW